jgi:hypothetical protein
MQLFEYYPLMSNRVHNFMDAGKNKILNVQFKQTYEKYMFYLAEVPQLLPHHYIALCYYLLL